MNTEKIVASEVKRQIDPWSDAAVRFPVGYATSGKVISFAWTGIVVELEENITGCVRLDAAELKAAVKTLAPADVVTVVVESVDVQGKMIGLRLREPVASHRNNTIVVGEPGKKLTAAYARGIPNGSDVQICDGVTAIGDRVFFGRALHSVAIPRTVKIIGKAAFRYSKVEAVVMDDGVEFIGENAFADCEKLRFVNLPQTLISVGSRAFLDDFQ